MLDADRLKSLLLNPNLTTPEDTECIDLIRKCPETALRLAQALLKDRTTLEESYRAAVATQIHAAKAIDTLKNDAEVRQKAIWMLKTDLEKAQREVKRLSRTVVRMSVKMFGHKS